MSMDGLSLYGSLWELSPLIGGRIDRVQQPDRGAVILSVRSAGKTYRLLISSHAQNGRIHLSAQSPDNPETPPSFCMLLRKKLLGARIEAIRQKGLDRVVCFELSGRDELMDRVSLHLIVELMGKYSNIILVGEDGLILDSIRRVGAGMSSVRMVLPGLAYAEPPGQDKINPFSESEDALTEAFSAAPEPQSWLISRYEGLSKSTVQGLFFDDPAPRTAAKRLLSLRAGPYRPCILYNSAAEPVAVYPFPLPGGEMMESLSVAYDAFYAQRDRAVRIQRNSAALRHAVETHLSRAENKLAAYEETIRGESKYAEYRLFGELITANLHRLSRGMAEAVLDNFYTAPPSPLIVPLNPLLSPQENAQRYFKQYKKSRVAREYALSRKSDVTEEIAYLSGQLDNIEKCALQAELAEIRAELTQLRYLRPGKGKKGQKLPPSKPMQFLSSDGIPLFAGKNNAQNDALTLKKAESEHYFFHAKNIPGSHVIAAFSGEPPKRTLLEAATLAAYYSKGRSSPAVEVDYTPRKYVKKPGGARPGLVTYSTNRTILVPPDPAIIKGLTRIQ